MSDPIPVQNARMRASKLLYDYGLDTASHVPVSVLAYDRGMLVGEKAVLGSEGRLIRRGNRSYAAIQESLKPAKKRFVVAHEFGHHELHRDEVVKVCDEAAFVSWNQRRPQEWEANVFASELLMPKVAFRGAALASRCGFKAVKGLAERFEVTLSAAALRYVMLNVFPCAIVFATGGRVSWVRVSETMPWKKIRRDTLDQRTGCAESFRGQDSGDALWTPAHAWFFDHEINSNDKLLEQCVRAPSINSVLSLLWLP